MNKRILYPLIFSLFAVNGCEQNGQQTMETDAEPIHRFTKSIESKRIYFAHMSVGQDIINGINDLLKENSRASLTIIDKANADTGSLPESFLLHSKVGENTKPVSKCLDYRSIVNSELKDKIDYALLKFCYIDINENTNVPELFDTYRSTIDKLISENPGTRFIHITVPLRYTDSGLQVWARELIGQPNKTKMANIKRNEFNNLLKDHYGRNQPVFDLAVAQSTYPDGRTETFTYKSDYTYNTLIGDYTYDGGHLNEYGRQKVARDFLKFLDKQIKQDDSRKNLASTLAE